MDPRQQQVEPIVLAKLVRWGRLTVSDIESMLTPIQRVWFTNDLVAGLANRGLVSVRVVGDEPVLSITDGGRDEVTRLGNATGMAP